MSHPPHRELKRTGSVSLKVSEKGAVSVYGLGRFPVTLYMEQWLKLLGMADELMYPGTMAFMRFASPARVDTMLRARIVEASERVLRGFGLTHGFFNLEFFVDARGGLKLIELNPRLAAQLAQMHDWVHGIDTYELGFAMALGRPVVSTRLGAEGRNT